LVSESADFTVERQALEIDVCGSKDREAWSLITALLKVRRVLCYGWNQDKEPIGDGRRFLKGRTTYSGLQSNEAVLDNL
jgi:hypothetical protein